MHLTVPNVVTGQLILVTLANHWGMAIDVLVATRGPYRLSRRRHIAIGLLRRYTDLTFAQISRLFGGWDHKSLIYGDRVYRRLRVDGDRLAVEAGHAVRSLFRSLPARPRSEVARG